MMKHYVTVDIGGTSIKYGLIDESDFLIEDHEMPTEAYKGGPSILEKVAEIVAYYQAKVEIAGICLSSAGMVDPVKGEIFYAGPQIPNYAGTQYKAELEKRFKIPCEIENDVNCAGLAEAVSGAGKDTKISVCLTIGTGIGGCLILDNGIYPGATYSACEVGYIHLPGGDFQDLASTTALVNFVAELHGDVAELWDGRRIFQEAKEGNQLCIQGIDRLCDYLGKGIANICYVANPEIVILGGGIMAQEEFLKPRIEAALKANLVSSLSEKTKLAFAQHKNTAGMLGAYYNFKNRQGLA